MAELTLKALWDAMTRVGSLPPEIVGHRWEELDEIANDVDRRTKLNDALAMMDVPNADDFRVVVREKGRKDRLVGFPVALMRDLVGTAIFEVRSYQLRRQAGEARRIGADHPWLFLSTKAIGRPLHSGSIGDILASAFQIEPVIQGSGHRLRAHHATMLAARIWRRLRTQVGGNTLVGQEAALTELAEQLGQRISVTLRYYMSLGMFYEQRHAAGADDAAAWLAAVGDLRRDMSAKRATLTLRAATAIALCDDDAELALALDEILGHFDASGRVITMAH